MLMKYQDGQFYPDSSIHVPLILEVLMVMLSLTYPPRSSITENNLKIFIVYRILRNQQEIFLSGEKLSPTRLIFQYTKALSKSDKINAFIAPKMTYLITLLNNNIKYAVYIGGNVHGINSYIEMIGSPTKLTTSGQRSHCFGPSSSINNAPASTQPVFPAIHMIPKII